MTEFLKEIITTKHFTVLFLNLKYSELIMDIIVFVVRTINSFCCYYKDIIQINVLKSLLDIG